MSAASIFGCLASLRVVRRSHRSLREKESKHQNKESDRKESVKNDIARLDSLFSRRRFRRQTIDSKRHASLPQFRTHVAIAYASNCLASPSAALVDPAAASLELVMSAASLAPTGLPASSAGSWNPRRENAARSSCWEAVGAAIVGVAEGGGGRFSAVVECVCLPWLSVCEKDEREERREERSEEGKKREL